MASSTIPVILIGATKFIGGRVAPKLKPEIEAIQFITSVERAKTEIPALRSGESVTPDPDNVGSHDFSKKPEIVIFGRGFGPEQIEEIYEACGGASSGLLWLQTEQKSREKVHASPPDLKDPKQLDQYTDLITATIKKRVAELKAEGKTGGMYTYV